MAFCYRGDPRHLTAGDGLTNGYATLPGPYRPLTVIFSDGLGWDHVSASTRGRPPNWAEMAYLKAMFWDPEDVVMQLHPAEAKYVNLHPHCLHLWRPQGVAIPQPPVELVGPLAPKENAPRVGGVID